MIGVQIGAALTEHADVGGLFRAWLREHDELGSAYEELQQFFGSGTTATVAGPAWNCPGWTEPWLVELLADLPDEAARERARKNVRRLAAGEADVVVTGQQPGFLGGPLYTYFKVAATVVLAEMRTAAGRPTVPLFWSGEDDDDLREATAPVAFDPARDVLLRHADHGDRALAADRMVGALPSPEIAAGAAAWLAEQAPRHGLTGDLARVWQEAVAASLPWGRLQRRALLRVFAGTNLLAVSGNDPNLHTAAAEFYGQLWNQRKELREAVRAEGARLASVGFDVPLAEASIERFLHVADGDHRRPLPADHDRDLPEAAVLRPGVLARSPIQDWLFRPVGVVIGPAEAAYLKQLAPGYEILGLSRSPLLPRLFAQLGPAGVGEFTAWALHLAEDSVRRPDRELDTVATRVARAGRDELEAVLQTEVGLGQNRAQRIADHVGHRWQRYVRSLLVREEQRRSERRGEGQPDWVRPGGARQERTFAALSACALWGDDLTAAILHASRRHFDAGLDRRWHEYLLTVPDL